ncbi:addiction module protein [Pseudoduganella namucuonensis]|uniref:Putative addiction module component, TIGR02574 family n=1 Tax=Pseudoduganella namucuonensis TaxID=1035707 RepID=A0A1I7KWA6_9BURK|nr:addiction module protein [Pseudoduganella namucuonensis]SFV01739.1 putative addiction module component, TIGR02574 family [Pseudoduganella namucuonensis]
MATQLEKLVTEALAMQEADRAALAQLLLESLHPDADYDEAWEREIERRVEEIENGTAQLIPLEDALAQVRATLK